MANLDIITTPWSNESVENLNKFQEAGLMHPFTCAGNFKECKRTLAYNKRFNDKEEVEYSNENEGVLTATPDGWICPCGKYKQDWAYDFMAF